MSEEFQYVIDHASIERLNLFDGNTKAYVILKRIVDMYDNIPYSEALQGTGNLSPKFDDDMQFIQIVKQHWYW